MEHFCNNNHEVDVTLLTQSKIADFDLHVVVEEEISQLQVSVDDLLVVEMFDAQTDLLEEVSGFRLCDGLSAFVQLHQRPPAAQLQQYVHVVGVLEKTDR